MLRLSIVLGDDAEVDGYDSEIYVAMPSWPGDADGNGLVDSAGLAIWQQHYDPLGLNDNTFGMGDWSGDGLIDSADLAIWQQHYDPLGTLGAIAVPEPTTMSLLGPGALLLTGRRQTEPSC